MRVRPFVLLAATPLLLGLTAARSWGQAPDLPRMFAFEEPTADPLAAGWGGGPPGTITLDSTVARSGARSARIRRDTSSDGEFSALSVLIPRSVSGARLELRGWLKTDAVVGFAGLWLRQDGPGGVVQFDNMASRRLAGTTDWTEYRIDLPLDDLTESIVLGILLQGVGTVWADDLVLLVDGLPIALAPPFERTGPPLEADREFDAGSRIEATPLNDFQIEDLALLGRVWGFTKYHHPRIAAAHVNWDYELFRVTPGILAAPDADSARRAMVVWLDRLGAPPPCSPCANLFGDLHLRPELAWIEEAGLLGPELSDRLRAIHRARPASGGNHYVAMAPGVGNPVFANEKEYRGMATDAGYRLLALFRYWNIIEYWFPYRDLIDEDWDEVLTEFIPRLMEAGAPADYQLEMLQLIARISDTHANLNTAPRPPQGTAVLPVELRFIEDRLVVAGYLDPLLGPATGLAPGDVIERIDGREVGEMVVSLAPFYPASNEPTRLRDIAVSITRGEAGAIRLDVVRPDETLSVTAERAPFNNLADFRGQFTHDLPGDAFQRLTDEVAYLKLSSVVAADAYDYIDQARDSEVLVVDIRNYPAEFVPFALGGYLVERPTPFVAFTSGDLANPGAFRWTPGPLILPLVPRFEGRIVILVDETSLSQAEYTAMAFRAAPGAIVVGSTTAAADGNVSAVPLPGGLRTVITGLGIFYPDRSPTQRIGIVPDFEVRPTIEGIRAGRDEVLEAGIGHALGRDFRLDGGPR